MHNTTALGEQGVVHWNREKRLGDNAIGVDPHVERCVIPNLDNDLHDLQLLTGWVHVRLSTKQLIFVTKGTHLILWWVETYQKMMWNLNLGGGVPYFFLWHLIYIWRTILHTTLAQCWARFHPPNLKGTRDDHTLRVNPYGYPTRMKALPYVKLIIFNPLQVPRVIMWLVEILGKMTWKYHIGREVQNVAYNSSCWSRFLLLNPWGRGWEGDQTLGVVPHILYISELGMVRVHGCSYSHHSKVQKWLEADDNWVDGAGLSRTLTPECWREIIPKLSTEIHSNSTS